MEHSILESLSIVCLFAAFEREFHEQQFTGSIFSLDENTGANAVSLMCAFHFTLQAISTHVTSIHVKMGAIVDSPNRIFY